MTRTETKGAEPNYFTLHCPCGDGFVWRTDDASKPYLMWMREHHRHDLSAFCASAAAALARLVALTIVFVLAYGAWWLAT